ncbi:hypothetical protein LCGC14_1030650 [marine sediment metagenome]|uniref:Uncharacterized protein n=1 Tax=marine sediment metagenome TaxID=412755 RepID=A0A0F9QCS6_9ZZZZ
MAIIVLYGAECDECDAGTTEARSPVDELMARLFVDGWQLVWLPVGTAVKALLLCPECVAKREVAP